jgi:3-dehydrosphinganine reductase
MNRNDPRTHAIVTGGSSGIGLATSRLMAENGISVTILGRDVGRLDKAVEKILSVASAGASVRAISCDVGNADDCRAAVEKSIAELGPPRWAVACAGIVTPGTFIDLSLDEHLRQLQTNYVGSLNLAHAVVPVMACNGGGHLVFVASGAALAGIYGYSAYAPSKFAVRGLAEVLSIELSAHGICVTLVHPPDTGTPQLAIEKTLRPKPTEVVAGTAGIMTPEQVAAALFRGAKRKKFLVVPGLQLRLLSRFQGVIGPGFRAYQRRVAARCQKAPPPPRGP